MFFKEYAVYERVIAEICYLPLLGPAIYKANFEKITDELDLARYFKAGKLAVAQSKIPVKKKEYDDVKRFVEPKNNRIKWATLFLQQLLDLLLKLSKMSD